MLRRAMVAAVVLAAGGLIVAWLAGTGSVSSAWYLRLVDASPNPVVSVASDVGLVALVALFVAAVWNRRRQAARLGTLVAGGLGVTAAYVASEGLKIVVAAERPCRAVVQLADCPGPGDWSFPSNHAVIAFSLLTCLAAARSRTWIVATLLAIAVGYARVAVGAHYPHDVVAGLVLGTAGAAGAMLLVGAPVRSVLEQAVRRVRGRRWDRRRIPPPSKGGGGFGGSGEGGADRAS